MARAEALTPLPEDLIAPLLREQWGGGTWDPRTGRFLDVEDGYTGGSVPNSETVTLSIDDAQDADKLMTAVRQAEEKFAAELERPNRYLGVFRDDKTGKVTIEPSIHVKSRETAEAIATELDAKGGFYDHGTGDGVFPLRDQHTTRVPEPGTPERAALDAARQRAQASVVQTAPALRAALEGEAKVIAGPVKSIRSIRRKAELNNGDWTGVDDIERYRLVAEDAWEPTKLQRLIDQVKETTGGTVRRIENSIGSPDDHGARGFRMVVEMPDGHAAEFSILTPDAMHVIDNTKMLHQVRTVLAARLARGGLDPRQEAQIAMELRMAEALSQQMWEGVTDGMRAARGGPAANSLRQRINRFRVDLWGETADPLLDRGLSIESAFENAHAAQRLRNGATHDPDQGWTGISSLELDALNAAEGKMAPVYYPHMDARLLPERGSLLRRNVRAGSGLGQDVNLKQNTLEVLQAGRESKDFRQVYRIRAEQAGRMRERMDVLFDLIDEYGRPIARPGDLRPDEVLFAPGLAKRLSGQHQAMLDSLATDPTGKGLGDMLDRFTAANAAELERLVSTGGDLEAFAVPKVVADRLRQHTKWIPDDRVQLLAGTTTDMWKGAVLSGSPRWMVNNLLGNVIFTKLQGNVPLGRVVRQLNKKYLARMREAIGPEALARIESGGQVKSLAAKARPVGDDVVSGVAGAIERNIGQRAVPRALRRYSAWAQRVNGSMEDAFRRASYLTAAEREAARLSVDSVGRRFWNSKKALEDAYRVGLDETRWTRAVDEMNSFMNDYQTATPFSRNIVKPYLVPFWSFYRHAAKMVLQMPFQHPAKATLLRQIAEADEERYRREGIDPQSMPGWLKGSALFTGRGEAGDFRFMSTAGMNPFNAVLDSPLNALHPASKMLYEQAMGRSTFTNRPFTDPNVQTAPFSDNAYRAEMRDGKPVMVPVTGTRPGLLEHALQQIPQYEMLKDVIAGGTTYDTSTIYDALRGRVGLGESALLTDSEGEPVTEKSAADMLARLFGYGTFDSDLERNMEFTAEEREKALEQWLEKHRTEDDSTEAATGSSWYG